MIARHSPFEEFEMPIFSRTSRWPLAMLICGFCIIFSPATSRAQFTFTLADFSNSSVSSPYATLNITSNAALGQVTFNISTAPNQATFTDFAFNSTVNSSNFNVILSSVTASGGNGSASDWTQGTGGNYDSYGRFGNNFGGPTNGNNPSGDRISELTFTVQFAAGDFSEATVGTFISANTNGDLFVLDYQPSTSSTGFVAAPLPSPEPSTVALAFSGILPFGFAWMRNRRLRMANCTVV